MWPFKMNCVILNKVNGIAKLSGVDTQGSTWTQFEVDYFAEQNNGECVICGEELTHGWFCLDGGDEVCNSHVRIRSYEE